MIMKHIYKNVYQDSNGDLFMVEKKFIGNEQTVTNLTEMSKLLGTKSEK